MCMSRALEHLFLHLLGSLQAGCQASGDMILVTHAMTIPVIGIKSTRLFWAGYGQLPLPAQVDTRVTGTAGSNSYERAASIPAHYYLESLVTVPMDLLGLRCVSASCKSLN